MNRVAAIVVNYNMPERADRLAEAIQKSKWPVDLILVDNGSDITAPSKYSTLTIEKNVQTTNGWLRGVDFAAEQFPYFAYMFIITSAEPASGDFVAACASVLAEDENAVGVHPALTIDSTTMWEHMKARGAGNRQTWMIDNICSMYRSDWFQEHRFDPDLIYGHGIDLEICYHARKEGRGLWITEGAQVRKITDIGYTMDRMNMTAEDRRRKAYANMTQVLSARYGAGYWQFLTNSHRTADME
jgi:hypothetical protein